jgi:ABC-type glycerol-3-phosphate transport system substrate-binding protein
MNGALVEDAVDFEIGFMNLPPVDPSKPLLTISDPGLVLMLPKDSKHPEEALDIIDWLLQPEFGLALAEAGEIPLHNVDLSGVTMSEPFMDEELSELPAQMPVGWLNYTAPYEFPDRQGSELQKLLAGDTDLDAYMEFLQTTYDEAIANK